MVGGAQLAGRNHRRRRRRCCAAGSAPDPICSGGAGGQDGQNRLHIDLTPDDQRAEVDRVRWALGARHVDIGQGETVLGGAGRSRGATSSASPPGLTPDRSQAQPFSNTNSASGRAVAHWSISSCGRSGNSGTSPRQSTAIGSCAVRHASRAASSTGRRSTPAHPDVIAGRPARFLHRAGRRRQIHLRGIVRLPNTCRSPALAQRDHQQFGAVQVPSTFNARNSSSCSPKVVGGAASFGVHQSMDLGAQRGRR